MLGRMAHWKGQLLGLRALAALRTSRRLAVTVAGGTWFGETAHQEKIRRFARRAPASCASTCPGTSTRSSS